MEQLVAKESTALVENSLHDILHWVYKEARTGVQSVVYNVVDEILFDLLREDVTDWTLHKHITKYFDTRDPNSKVGEKLLSTYVFMGPIPALIQRRTSEAVTVERVSTKMEKQLRLQRVDADAKCCTKTSVSLPSHTDAAPIYSPSDRDYDAKAGKCLPGTAHILAAVMDTIKGQLTLTYVKDMCQIGRMTLRFSPTTTRPAAVFEGRIIRGMTDSNCHV